MIENRLVSVLSSSITSLGEVVDRDLVQHSFGVSTP